MQGQVVAIKLSMLIKGRNSVRASDNANKTWTLWYWIPQATEQNLRKFMLHLYHEVSVSGAREQLFNQPLIFENQTGKEQHTDKF